MSATKMVISNFLGNSKKKEGSIEDGTEIDRNEGADSGQELLRNNSLSTWPSFLDTFTKFRGVQEVSCYSVSIFEQIHNPQLGIFKLMNGHKKNYFSSDRLRTGAV